MNDETTLAELFLGVATSKQREAVISEDDLVVVSAGAGSGKTRTLSWRFAWLVATGSARHDEILTITYTEKAAQEMEDKILSTLNDWLKALETSDIAPKEKKAVAERLAVACNRFDEAQISTIHSFAMNLLKSYGQFLEINPNFNIVTPQQEDIFYESAVNALDLLDENWFSQNAPLPWHQKIMDLISDEAFRDVLDFYGPRVLIDLGREACSIFGSRSLNPDELFRISTTLEKIDEKAIELIFNSKADRKGLYSNLYNFWIEEVNVDAGNKDNLSQRVRDFQNRWGKTYPDSPPEWARFLVDLNDEVLSNIPGRGTFKEELEALLFHRLGHEGLKIHRESLSQDVALARWIKDTTQDRPLREMLLKFASIIWAIWEEHKKRLGILSFDDLLIKAKDMVTQHPEIANRYKYILVDEFQDTNGIQSMLIENIKTAKNDQPAKLFIVGDLKQSIYRFRHANLEIFADYIKRAQEGSGRYVYLSESFRMTNELLDEINSLFGHLWREGISSSLRHPYEPLAYPDALKNEDVQSANDNKIGDLMLLLETTTEDGEGKKVGATRRKNLLASNLAGLFDMLHEGGTQWKDMVVLVPSRNYYDPLEEAFEKHNIPAVFVEQKSFFSRSETLDATALLSTLSDLKDDFALIGLLSSPFLRLSQEAALKAISSIEEDSNGRGRAWKYVKANLPTVARKIEDLRHRAFLRGPSNALNYLLEDPLWLLSAPPHKRPRVFSNMRHLIQILRGYEEALGKDVAGAAHYLKNTTRFNVPYEEATPLGEDEDVVRVMTVHAAKGLEFPVVAVFGLEHHRHPRSGSSLVPSIFVGAVASSYPDPLCQKESPPSKAVHDYLEGTAQDEESLRLFYVACTRAKNRLILCGSCALDSDGAPSKRTGLWLKALLGWPEAEKIVIPEALLGKPKPKLSDEQRTKKILSQAVSLKKLSSMIPTSPVDRLSATEYAIISWCPHAYRLGYKQGLPLKWELPRSEDYGGPDVGSLVHWILARWDLRKESLAGFFPQKDDDLEALLRLLPTGLRPVLKDKTHWTILMRWLEAFRESPLGLSLQNVLSSKSLKGQVHREIPFSVNLDIGTRLAGQIDLIYHDKEGIHLWDYKITEEASIDSKSLMGLYSHQVKFYGYVVRRQFPHKPVEMGLYLLREGKAIGVKTDNISFDDVEKQIKDAAFVSANGPYKKNTHNCLVCPWKNLCAKEA
ncbi:UvrD-helicase domain-containing protein [Acetomicrobium sp.]|jgi:ATP-dependent helicase/nuclease subunit A|uniref:UvrD-helicase domain-containing protein n=1 Tax=Acetomicrobium sp. TaxID=1872099 RepID=UPI002D083DA2|nr:UvrD-helicase domain-containing protein [Acetomicrobium sp.]